MTSHNVFISSHSGLFVQPSFSLTKLHTIILFAGLTLLLVACGGGGSTGGAGNNRELQLYQNAIAAYQVGNFSNAITLFDQQLAEFPSGGYSDESHYKQGRSYHSLENFTAARDAYGQVSSSSAWIDNADFYVGKSYYDEAGTLADPVSAFAVYETAIIQLNAVISTYVTSNFVNSSYYYIGRSYQKEASIKQGTLSVSVKTELQLFADARTNYDLVQPVSIFYDNALYFKGRSYHEQVPADYVNARAAYQLLITANVSSWADDAKYQYGKTFYESAGADPVTTSAMSDFTTAIAEFSALISPASTNLLYQTSNRADSARYYKARSLHKQAALVETDPTLDSVNTFSQYYLSARTAYQSVITFDAASAYADNAQYRIGKTYYDEARVALRLADYSLVQQNLDKSIAAFNGVITHALYQLSNSADNAHYYLGRSYQVVAAIPAVDRITVAGGIDFTAVNYATARTQFEVLTGTSGVAPQYPGSAWIDNAYYEIGNGWYADAQSAVAAATDPLADYTAALLSYNKVLTDYPNASTREDNSALKIGAIYHDAGYCVDEQRVLNYLLVSIDSAKVSAISTANIHVVDLAIAITTPTATHPCVENTANLPKSTL